MTRSRALLPLLLAMCAPIVLSACWLPPAEVIKAKGDARRAWKAKAKQRAMLVRHVPDESARVTAAAPPPNLMVDVPGYADDALAMIKAAPAAPAKPVGNKPPEGELDSAKPGLFSLPDTGTKPRKPSKDAPQSTEPSPATRQAGALTPVEGVANMMAITRPSSPLAVDAPWQDAASPAALRRIDGWRARFDRDVDGVIARGQGMEIGKGGRLFEGDAAMLYGLIPPGLYDCRLFHINGAQAAWTAGTEGKCRVILSGEDRRLSFITTEEIMIGTLYDNDAFSSVFLGKGMVTAMGGGTGSADEIGLVQRVADTRWRIILPGEGGGGSHVVEITRPRRAE